MLCHAKVDSLLPLLIHFLLCSFHAGVLRANKCTNQAVYSECTCSKIQSPQYNYNNHHHHDSIICGKTVQSKQTSVTVPAVGRQPGELRPATPGPAAAPHHCLPWPAAGPDELAAVAAGCLPAPVGLPPYPSLLLTVQLAAPPLLLHPPCNERSIHMCQAIRMFGFHNIRVQCLASMLLLCSNRRNYIVEMRLCPRSCW